MLFWILHLTPFIARWRGDIGGRHWGHQQIYLVGRGWTQRQDEGAPTKLFIFPCLSLNFHKPKAVSETDDMELAALMARATKEITQVSGDEAEDDSEPGEDQI